MNIAQKCINRPVFTLVAMLLMMIIGLLAYKQLNIRHYPNISQPTISVVTRFNGASPDLIEKEITIPLENILSGVNGIVSVQSNSSLAKSRISISFKIGTDINEAINEIRNKSAEYFRKLPEGTEMPQVFRNDEDGDPVAIVGFQDKHKSALEITDYINRYISPAFQETPGVGQVSLFGARNYAIKIELDPVRMAAHKITVAEIKRALRQQNIDIPGGQIQSKNRFYTVVAHAKLTDPGQFDKLVIGHQKRQSIHLGEVASIIVGNDNEESILRFNGKSAVGLAIYPQSTANPIDVTNSVRKTLKQLRLNFPQDFSANIFFDSTEYIKRSIFEVYKTFFEAVLFVSIVVFLFMGSLRTALIPIVTIPICIISSFAPMYWLGYELNTLTMLALVLAIGLVVDDAIVVLENCHRHITQGQSAINAAISGGKEITFALIAMTITLTAVYLPMAFVEGFTGTLLQQFGITLAIAVLISGLVALTLTPLMCAKMLTNKESRYSRWVDTFFEKLSKRFENSLRFSLSHSRLLFIFLMIALMAGVYSLLHSGSELAPIEDRSFIVSPVSGPTDTSTEYIDQYVKQIESMYSKIPEQANWMVSIRPGSAFTLLKLVPWEQRERSQQEISQSLASEMKMITGISAAPVNNNPLSQRGGNQQFSMALLSNRSFEQINEAANHFIKAMEMSPLFQNVKNNFSMDSEQIDIQINRQLANDLEVNLADISELIATMVGGNNPVNYTYDGQSYRVVLQMKQEMRRDISVLNQLYVQSARGQMIPLSSLISISNSIGPNRFPHLNRLRSIDISANLAPDARMSDAIDYVQNLAKSSLPDGIQYRFTGGTEEYLESSNSSNIAFVLALIFIYLVLAAQFESFIDPLIVLLSVPLCLLGAVTTLYLLGINLSIYSTIGLITLIGLISKHGILITEYANRHLSQNDNPFEAITYATRIRLRPILMTTLAMILGALPLALASGAGAESRRILGIVILSGMSLGTLFSLYVVPFAWLSFNRLKHLKRTRSTSDATLPATNKI